MPPTFEEIDAVVKALKTSKVPDVGRAFIVNHDGYIALGGTEAGWQRLMAGSDTKIMEVKEEDVNPS